MLVAFDRTAADRIAVALDCSEQDALDLARKLQGHAHWVKVGMTLYYATGPSIITALHKLGMRVFLDLKLHDIPHQVEGAAHSAARVGADLLTIHALGGAQMITAARQGIERAHMPVPTKLLAVTMLTSTSSAHMQELGIDRPLEDEVAHLAQLACGAGADGIVCSPREARRMRSLLGSRPMLVCPGIRPAGSPADDQARTATPQQALKDGATLLVVGRPITQAADPVAAFHSIRRDMACIYE